MTVDTRGSAIDSVTAGVASKGALIATFYGYREAALNRSLIERLCESLDLKPQADDPRLWRNSARKAMLSRIDPETAHDATITQLALNAPGNAADAWDEMRQQLEAARLQSILDVEDLSDYWGCTLTYHAVLNPDVDPEAALRELLPAVRRLHSSESPRSSLAQADMWGGRVWLVDIPDPDDGWTAATVYVALNPFHPPDQARVFVPGTIYGRKAALLMPDLISHKGYHQMRQYRADDLGHLYKESMKQLRHATRQLLSELGQQPVVETDNLNQLARKYNSLVPIASDLNQMRLSMARQLHNYNRWRTALKGNGIIDFHRGRLETANLELELMVDELRDALETADKAVSLAQVKVDKVQAQEDKERELRQREADKKHEDEQRAAVLREQEADRAQQRDQRVIQNLLAMVAVALGLSELIDKEFAERLIGAVGWLIGLFLGAVPMLDQLKNDAFAQLVTQIILILILAIPIWFFGVRRWLRKQRESPDSEDG